MKALIILTLFFATCSSRSPQTAQAPTPPPTSSPSTAQHRWEPVFFRDIDRRAHIAKLPNLRTASLATNDVELRIWIGFGLSPLTGFVIKRSGGEWSGVYLAGTDSRPLPPPKSGWDSFWKQLTSAGILSLPDAETINCGGGAEDGVCYVVETNVDKAYRTFMYDNPQFAKCDQAKQMLEINRILSAEFVI